MWEGIGYSYVGQRSSTLAKTGHSRTGKGFPITYRTGFSSPNKRDAAIFKRPKRNNSPMFCWQRRPHRIKFYPMSAYFLRVFQHLLLKEVALRHEQKPRIMQIKQVHPSHITPSAQAITPDTALSSTNTLTDQDSYHFSSIWSYEPMVSHWNASRSSRTLKSCQVSQAEHQRSISKTWEGWWWHSYQESRVDLQTSALTTTTFSNNPYANVS